MATMAHLQKYRTVPAESVAFMTQCGAAGAVWKYELHNTHSTNITTDGATHFPPDRRSLAKSQPSASFLVANEYSIKSGNFLPFITSSSVGYSRLSIRRTVDIDRLVLVQEIALTP